MSNEFPSRLSTSTEDLRSKLLSRNLYSPVAEYPRTNQSTVTKVVKAVDSIANSLIPFKSVNLENTALGRLVTDKTPIAQIGLIMLGKQMALNVKSHGINEVFKSIDIPLDLKKNPKAFSKKYNYSITAKSKSGFLGLIEKVTGTYTNLQDLPSTSTLDLMITNTGNGQLSFLFAQLNKNQYKSNDLYNYNDVAKSVGGEIEKGVTNNPLLKDTDQYVDLTNQEYGNDRIDKFIGITNFGIETSAFGKTSVDLSKTEAKPNGWINDDDGFNKTQNIVWGDTASLDATFSVKKGLLDYTNNLMKTGALNIDMTRKMFKDSTGRHFNGSGVHDLPAESVLNGATEGLRQHTMLDPYDRYAKAIRFNGNSIFGGNPNSTIYKTVIPKFHPILTDHNEIDNRNLMFSIENLAYELNTTSAEELSIPKQEIGQLGGRLMWFPPYNIKFNEATNTKFITTPILGRSEPIYSYTGSERSGTLSFSLLVDYPQELSGSGYIGYGTQEQHRKITEFFAYGIYDKTDKKTIIKDLDKKIADLKNKIDTVQFTPLAEPDFYFSPFECFFVNNFPTESNVDTVFQEMYEQKYEVFPGEYMSGNHISSGKNKDIYDTAGYSDTIVNGSHVIVNANPTEDQYTFIGNCPINSTLTKFIQAFSDKPEYLKNYSIYIKSTTTALGSTASNKLLSQRRTAATIKFIESKIDEICYQGDYDSFNKHYILYEINNVGTAPGNTDTNPNTQYYDSAKEARVSSVFIERNSTPIGKKLNVLNADQRKELEELKAQLIVLESASDSIKNNDNRSPFANIYKEKKPIDANDQSKLITGSRVVSENYFSPVFHSQTPEDFHRRLTFLQQCMRQGNPQVVAGDTKGISNSVFGKQPILVLRVGDFMFSKIIPDVLTIDYTDAPWDLNPEGFGLQYMLCNITLNFKIIGGQSLKGPIDILQNAISRNYYANSTYTNKDIYALPSSVQNKQYPDINNGLMNTKNPNITAPIPALVIKTP